MQQSRDHDELIRSLYVDWNNWLRGRHLRLATSHEELMQDAAAGLTQFLSNHPNLPDPEIRKVAFTILRRRVADEFKSRVREWSRTDLSEIENLPDPADPVHQQRISHLLTFVAGFLSEEISADDSALLARYQLAKTSDSLPPLTDAERQRLRRLRLTLRTAIRERFGAEVEDFFKE